MMSKEKSLLLRCCSLSLALFILLGVGEGHGEIASNSTSSSSSSFNFVKTRGTEFVMNGRPLYLNGFNAYWLLYLASAPSTRTKVSTTFQQASTSGMNAARTWAFSDGGYRALQQSPGSYNEDMFKVINHYNAVVTCID